MEAGGPVTVTRRPLRLFPVRLDVAVVAMVTMDAMDNIEQPSGRHLTYEIWVAPV